MKSRVYRTSRTLRKQSKKTGLQFPEKAVLVITTHGEIPYKFQKMKNPMNSVTYVKMAPTGECNFMYRRNVLNVMSMIDTYIPNLLNSTDDQPFIEKIVEGVIDEQRPVMEYLLQEENKNESVTSFFHTFENPREVETIGKNQDIINKHFIRSDAEKNGVDYAATLIYIDKQGNTKHIDIFDLVTTYIFDKRIGLHQIINYLKQRGIHDLIVFDFSCDIYIKNDQVVSPRTKRSIRRNTKKLKHTK